jgi:hypothetical protein
MVIPSNNTFALYITVLCVLYSTVLYPKGDNQTVNQKQQREKANLHVRMEGVGKPMTLFGDGSGGLIVCFQCLCQKLRKDFPKLQRLRIEFLTVRQVLYVCHDHAFAVALFEKPTTRNPERSTVWNCARSILHTVPFLHIRYFDYRTVGVRIIQLQSGPNRDR